MIYNVYAIRDFKTGFLSPTLEQNDAAAARNFEHAVLQSEQTLFFTHPEDYALYRIGEFNTDDGSLSAPALPEEILTASQVFNSAMSRRIKEVSSNGKDESK